MKKFNFFLVCGILAAMFLATGCDEKNSPENPENPENPNIPVPDPQGTVRVSVRDWNNGATWITPDGFISSFGIRNENFIGSGNGWSFASVGRVNGLGNVTQIPASGWANQVAIVPGHGYVARQSLTHARVYARMYAIDWVVSTGGGIIGAEIQYQSPFYIEEYEPEPGTPLPSNSLSAKTTFILGRPGVADAPATLNGINWTSNPNVTTARFTAQNIALANKAAYDAIQSKEALAEAIVGKTFVSTFEAQPDAIFGGTKYYIIKDGSTLRLVEFTSLTFNAGTNRAHFTERH